MDEAVIQNLKDAGCTQRIIADFLECVSENRIELQLRILSRHRRTLLEEIHTSQRKLYCLDYLYQEIKTAGQKEACSDYNMDKENAL